MNPRRRNPYCLSSFLAFRYVVDPEAEWSPGIRPIYPRESTARQENVETAEQVRETIDRVVRDHAGERTGILLSGGMDSAIIAAMLPSGSRAYTVRFLSPGSVDESDRARSYAEHCGIVHTTVEVGWNDYERDLALLMKSKKAPLHAIEVALRKAALAARADGVTTLIAGNGADSTFGGMDKLLSRDYTLEEFYHRYTFVDPCTTLKEYVDMRHVYEPFIKEGLVDTQQFLKKVHGTGIIQSFHNAISSAGIELFEPFEHMYYGKPLDLARIRTGDSKYVLRELFEDLYPGTAVPDKIPFARPMDAWLKKWPGPHRGEFRADVDYAELSGEQRWLVYCLEEFLDLLDQGRA
jgi:asparagine synthetase B (glutamine-hydrolysing)